MYNYLPSRCSTHATCRTDSGLWLAYDSQGCPHIQSLIPEQVQIKQNELTSEVRHILCGNMMVVNLYHIITFIMRIIDAHVWSLLYYCSYQTMPTGTVVDTNIRVHIVYSQTTSNNNITYTKLLVMTCTQHVIEFTCGCEERYEN